MAGMNLQTLGQDTAASVSRMNGAQRVTLALAFVATAIGIFLVAKTTGSTPMTALFVGMEPSAASEVVAELESRGVNYELQDGGRMIQVPSDQVYNLRIDLFDKNIAGGDGWKILDQQGMTTTVWQQEVAFQRAMEGELARTISAINGISSANVHLAIPEDRLLIGEDNEPSAAVLLRTSGSDAITSMQVDAIVNLVASSIEGMSADQVSVADQDGRVLAANGESGAVAGLEGETQMRATLDFERNLENDIERMLTNLVGFGLASVNVTAELNFDKISTVSEQNSAVLSDDGQQMLAEQTTSSESYDGTGGAAEEGDLEIENPDEALGLDPDATDSDGVVYQRDDASQDFLENRTVTNSQNGGREIQSLSVAVLIDEGSVAADSVADIENLVRATAGLSDQRGDVLAVSFMPFNDQIKAALEASNSAELLTEGEAAAPGMDLISLIRTIGTVIVALVVIIIGLRMSKGPKRKVVESIDLQRIESESESAAELAAGGGSAAAGVLAGAAQLAAGEEDEDREPAEEVLQSLIANQTDDVAGVLRTWLNDGDEVFQ